MHRLLIRKGGIPKFLIKYLVEDLIEYNLLERINFNTYKILKNKDENRMRLLVNSCF